VFLFFGMRIVVPVVSQSGILPSLLLLLLLLLLFQSVQLVVKA